MSTNDGGPAFPVLMKVGEIAQAEGGMSLRDYFAAKAMAALIVANNANSLNQEAACETMREAGIETSRELFAHLAYSQADAMLSARSQEENK